MTPLSSWFRPGNRVRPASRRPKVRPRLERLEDRCTPTIFSIFLNPIPINSVEGAAFSNTVATFLSTDPVPLAANFSAVVNWGDGTPPVTLTSVASANGQIIADPTVAGKFDVVGIHTFAEEGQFNFQLTVTDAVDGSAASTSFFSQTNLVTDNQTVLTGLGYAPAAHVDANLINPWGMSFLGTSPFWVSDAGAGVSTLYDGSGVAQALVVTIPASANSGATSPAPVTGQVSSASTTDFLVAGAGTAARFIFATEDGTIAAWNSGTSAVLKVDNSDFVDGPVYKGLAIGNTGTGNFLYATNFRGATIDVYDTNFAKVTLGSGGFGTFTDPTLPAGYAPFGIQNIGGRLYVTYALQDAEGKDDVPGAGNGFVDVFGLNGNFQQRLVSNGALNSPWGLAIAPVTFGAFAGDLLVGNFGDGRISAYDAFTGTFKGQVADAQNQPIAIDGLWALSFGNNGTAGPVGTLFFTAGINEEADGLFGSLTAVNTSVAAVADAALLPGNVSVSATAFTGVGGNNTSVTAGSANAALTAFAAAVGGVNNGNNPPLATGGFRAINWDAVALDGTDFGGNTTVIDANHVVGIPINRFQARGVEFEQVYAVSGAASATDTSTFSTVNPTTTNLFKPFSPTKTFAMFNDNTIDLTFVLASGATTTPVPAATRGFGAIFENVRLANTTSIEYFNGDTSLGKFYVPVGAAGQAEFLGELFASPVVTRVSLTLGTDVLFSFDGVTFHAGAQPDDPVNGHNLVVTDDFVYAEPVALTANQPTIKVNEGAPFTGVVATFTDLNANAAVTDFTATITWGDGHTSRGTVTAAGGGVFTVSGTNTFATPGTSNVSVLIQDVGGSQVTVSNVATVKPVYLVAGADLGQTPRVKVYDALTGAIKFDFLAYGSVFSGGVHVATGDVDGDGVPDIITGAGATGGPHVEVFSGVDAHLMASFYAYSPGFTGGVFVAAGDVNGDGKADIITGAGAGGGPHVKVVDATKLGQLQANGQISDGALLQSFFAYNASFAGGVRVAAGTVNADGLADVITGAGAGGGPHVKVFSAGNPTVILGQFMAFSTSYTGGIFVAAGDLNGDGRADIVVGQGQGTSAQVSTFSGVDFHTFGTITPFAGQNVDGVRVAAMDRDSDGLADVVVGTGLSKSSIVASFKGTTLASLGQFAAFDPSFFGGVFVG